MITLISFVCQINLDAPKENVLSRILFERATNDTDCCISNAVFVKTVVASTIVATLPIGVYSDSH